MGKVGSWLVDRRGRAALAFVLLLALFLVLRGFYRRELYHFTGGAEWMWVTDDVRVSRPTAALFACRVELHDRPQRAVAKVCGERQYVLWVNGQPAAAGQNRPSFHLDVVPVTDLLAAGSNSIVVEVRSHTSVGAVLFALDLEPSAEGRRRGDPRGRNVLTSGSRWVVATSWRAWPDPVGSTGRRPWIWGRPPDRPWSFPAAVVWGRPLVQAVVSEPLVRGGTDFRHAGEGRWQADLGRTLGGMLWLDLGGSSPPPRRVTVGSTAAGGGFQPTRSAPVVAVPDQDRWLFPGHVEGNAVEVEGNGPPQRIELVETSGL